MCTAQVQAQGRPWSGGGERRRRGGGEEESEEALSIMRISCAYHSSIRSYQIVSDRIMTNASVRIRSYRIVSDHIMMDSIRTYQIISCRITIFVDLAPYQMCIRTYRHVSEWGLVSVSEGHTYHEHITHITNISHISHTSQISRTYQTRINIYHTYQDSTSYRCVSRRGVCIGFGGVCVSHDIMTYHEVSHTVCDILRYYCDMT